MGRMMNDLLKARVAAQQGAFTTRDAADCGYVGRALTALVRSGPPYLSDYGVWAGKLSDTDIDPDLKEMNRQWEQSMELPK